MDTRTAIEAARTRYLLRFGVRDTHEVDRELAGRLPTEQLKAWLELLEWIS